MDLKIGNKVLVHPFKDKKGDWKSIEGYILESKTIKGFNIFDDYNIHKIEFENQPNEWVNEIYLKKA